MDADVVLAWYVDRGPPSYMEAVKATFTRPTRWISMPAGPGTNYAAQMAGSPTALQKIIKDRAPDVTPLRVCLIGFSEGCQGVRAALLTGDGPRVDAVYAVDGIHTLYTNKPAGVFSTDPLRVWKAACLSAAKDERLVLITTSAIPDFKTGDGKSDVVSSTNTSDYLWSAVNESLSPGQLAPEADAPPHEDAWAWTEDPPFVYGGVTYKTAPSRRYRKRGSLVIENFRNVDPTGVADHIYQAWRVAPRLLYSYIIARWNENPPASSSCLISV